ncbi:MAG: hypothetical protein E6G09_08290 [Actinobacteria bacterium]|nr:MAG: hypothetical protein E6G09_08290 [Actinomycetota bacterium]
MIDAFGHLLRPTAPTHEFQEKPFRLDRTSGRLHFEGHPAFPLNSPIRVCVMDNQTPRRGRSATSSRTESPRTPIELGDINDLHAFVRRIARSITQNESDLEELIGEGTVLAVKRSKELTPGDGLQKSLTGWLEFRLRDQWRKQHRELRRNSRAGTTHLLPAPTGLSWEHAATTIGQPSHQ